MSVINDDIFYKKKDPLNKKAREFYKKSTEIPNPSFKLTLKKREKCENKDAQRRMFPFMEWS